jgi:hypothetical protein
MSGTREIEERRPELDLNAGSGQGTGLFRRLLVKTAHFLVLRVRYGYGLAFPENNTHGPLAAPGGIPSSDLHTRRPARSLDPAAAAGPP